MFIFGCFLWHVPLQFAAFLLEPGKVVVGWNCPLKGGGNFPAELQWAWAENMARGALNLGRLKLVFVLRRHLCWAKRRCWCWMELSPAPVPSVGWSPEGRNSNDVWPSRGCSRLLPASSWTLWGTWGLTICQPGTLVRGSKHPGFISLLKQPCARCYFSVMQQDFWLFFFSSYFPLSRNCSIYQVTLSFKQNATNMLTVKHAT